MRVELPMESLEEMMMMNGVKILEYLMNLCMVFNNILLIIIVFTSIPTSR